MSVHTESMCLAVPRRRLCMGSTIHIRMGLKYGRLRRTEYRQPLSRSILFCSASVFADICL